MDYKEKLPSHVSVEVLKHKHGNKALPAHKPLGSTWKQGSVSISALWDQAAHVHETPTNTAGIRAEAAAAKSRGMCYKLKLFKIQNGPINEHFFLMYRRLASEADMN